MKNIKDTAREERDNRLEELREERQKAYRAYLKAKFALTEIEMEITQIETANNTGRFIEIGR